MSLPAFARLLLCLLLCSAPLVHAQTGDTSTAPLHVGITEVPPFVIADGNGDWEGISIDLWRAIADRQGWTYEWQVMPFSDLLGAVERGEVDVVVGALTMTSEREAVFDFSHPFYQTGLSIGVPHSPKQGLLQSLKALFSWGFLSVIGALALLLLGVGFALWLLERRRNAEQFGGSNAEGIGAGFWWAAVTMTTVGYGDKAPVTLGGRLLALVWMFAGLIMVAAWVTLDLPLGPGVGVYYEPPAPAVAAQEPAAGGLAGPHTPPQPAAVPSPTAPSR